jgi:hypothetical protein
VSPPAHAARPLALGIMLGACASAPDPLDPDAIDDIAKDEGDAEGDARSGTYLLKATGTRACDCPQVQGIDLCAFDLVALRDGSRVDIAQYDGYLLLTPTGAPAGLALTGPLDGGGDFDLGGLYDLGTALGEGSLLTRMIGAFTGPDRFTATLRTRIDGSFGDDSVDCRTEIDLTGERTEDVP